MNPQHGHDAPSQYSLRERFTVLASSAVSFWLDAFDLWMLSFILVPVAHALDTSVVAMGGIISLQFIFSTVGGIVFGRLADLVGRKKILVITVLLYSLGGLASALSWNVEVLAVSRAIAGLGLGGEWGVGMTIFQEVWTASRRRGLGTGVIQSCFNFALLAASAAAHWSIGTFDEGIGWRIAMCFTALPIIVAMIVRRVMPESKLWREYEARRKGGDLPQEKQAASRVGWELLRRPILRYTLLTLAVVSFSQFAYQGVSAMWPTMMGTVFDAATAVAAVTIGATLAGAGGQILAGFLSDILGRRVVFVACMAVWVVGVVMLWYFTALHPSPVPSQVWLWPAFWAYVIFQIGGTGNFAMFGVWLSEIFPTELRGFGVSAVYTAGRGVAAIAPVLVPALAPFFGLPNAMTLTALPLVVAGLLVALILPETLGRRLYAVEIVSDGGAKGLRETAQEPRET